MRSIFWRGLVVGEAWGTVICWALASDNFVAFNFFASDAPSLS